MQRFVAHPTGISGLQAVSGASDHRFPRHTHDDFGIGFVAAGGQISASGRGQVEAGPGDIITVNPGEVHDGAPIGDARTWHMLYLHPELVERIGEGLEAGRLAALEFHHPVMKDQKRARRFAAAWQRIVIHADGPAPALAADEALLELFDGLLDRRRQGDDRPSGEPAGIRRLRAMIDDDPLADHSLARLAREAGLSRFQTLRAFARATGLTPHAYLLERRVQQARRMILAGADLADTAAASGFADQSHMTREFRKRYGLTPATARKAAAIPFKTSASNAG